MKIRQREVREVRASLVREMGRTVAEELSKRIGEGQERNAIRASLNLEFSEALGQPFDCIAFMDNWFLAADAVLRTMIRDRWNDETEGTYPNDRQTEDFMEVLGKRMHELTAIH